MILAFGMPGTTELIIILLIIIIFFGVGKLPQVLGQMGKGVRAFKDGMREDENLKELADAADVSDAEEVRAKQKTSSSS